MLNTVPPAVSGHYLDAYAPEGHSEHIPYEEEDHKKPTRRLDGGRGCKSQLLME